MGPRLQACVVGQTVMPLKEMRTIRDEQIWERGWAMDEAKEVSFCGDLLYLRCKWGCPVNSWSYDFEIQKKFKQYKIGSPKVENKNNGK